MAVWSVVESAVCISHVESVPVSAVQSGVQREDERLAGHLDTTDTIFSPSSTHTAPASGYF